MELTLKDLKELIATDKPFEAPPGRNPFIGEWVIVRCRDAGVHFGRLESANGRECRLSESRRLWYWKPKKGAFLSAVSQYGLDSESKVGTRVDIYLTENCEIILCTDEAVSSINSQPNSDSGSDSGYGDG